jgi:hypothetical protein
MSPSPGDTGRSAQAVGRRRWWVHLTLIVTAAVSLALEPLLTLHMVLGLVFVGFVAVHLAQRRRVSAVLVSRLRSLRSLPTPAGRLALADAALTVLTLAMFASGLWDWGTGHPTRIRWHAITGVLLAGFLLLHSVRRRSRLLSSVVR